MSYMLRDLTLGPCYHISLSLSLSLSLCLSISLYMCVRVLQRTTVWRDVLFVYRSFATWCQCSQNRNLAISSCHCLL